MISYIILDNKDRTDAALLGADHRVQICIEQITTPDSLSHTSDLFCENKSEIELLISESLN